MDPIMELAGENNLRVIEDCIQSHGSKYKGRYMGLIGDYKLSNHIQKLADILRLEQAPNMDKRERYE